ncbi:hypothetical protein, partial [Escherichia coli]|uniref:hypothetical protein n=1 Tax=Escherichia coli TaxID=562 RepID=UPI0020237704
NQESRLPPGSDFRRWVWITIAPFVTKILASADSQQKSDIREALKLLGQFQQQQGDNARADAELVLKSQAQGHAQRMDISSILQKSTQQQPQQ